MTATPLVSVIIPAYNSAPFIEEALQSVMAQSFRDFEVIVVDDGSVDSTKEVVCRFPLPVLLEKQDHQGPAAARNKGVGMCKGRLIAFLDSDDRWRPEKLAQQVQLMGNRSHIAMTMTGHVVFDEQGIRKTTRGLDKRRRLLEGDPVRNIFLHSGVATPTVMVARQVFDKLGGFDEQLRMSEDDNLWMRIAYHYEIDLIDAPLTEIRMRPGSMTGDILELKLAFDQHVELLKDRYKEIGDRVASLIPIRAAAFEFAAGRHYLSKGSYAEARLAFGQCVNLRPEYIKYRLWKGLSYAPDYTMGWLRGIRRCLKGCSHG